MRGVPWMRYSAALCTPPSWFIDFTFTALCCPFWPLPPPLTPLYTLAYPPIHVLTLPYPRFLHVLHCSLHHTNSLANSCVRSSTFFLSCRRKKKWIANQIQPLIIIMFLLIILHTFSDYRNGFWREKLLRIWWGWCWALAGFFDWHKEGALYIFRNRFGSVNTSGVQFRTEYHRVK